MSGSFKSKFLGRSKSHKKESKYIPAAIIPSAAFVVNPTRPTSHQLFDGTSNKLLNSTLSSSLVGLSAEFRRHQNNDINNFDENDRAGSLDRHVNYSGYEMPESFEEIDIEPRKKKKKKIRLEKSQDSKRHINIANGLYDNNSPESRLRNNREEDGIMNRGRATSNVSLYSLMDEDKSLKNVSFSNAGRKVGYERRGDSFNDERDKERKFKQRESHNKQDTFSDVYDEEINPGISGNMRSTESLVNVPTHFREIGHENNSESPEQIYSVPSHSSRRSAPKVEDTVSMVYDEEINPGISENKTSVESLVTVPTHFKDKSHENDSLSPEQVYSVPTRSTRSRATKVEDDDRNVRQLKDEIRALQDLNYRLNCEISVLIPDEEGGRSIGKSVFPGKGPAPNWIMNTKYLAPLLAVYDSKFQQQNLTIQRMKGSIMEFEKDLRNVINENKQLHSLVSDSRKNGPTTQSEWLVIIDQTKLVIEENQLLVQELNIQQQRNKELENKYVTEVAQLRTSLATVTSERDLGNKEVASLIGKMSEMKCCTNMPNPNGDTSLEIHSLKSQVDDLLRSKRSLEEEVNVLRDKEKKMEKKVEKLKSLVKSEKEFRQYLNNVLDKGNEIALERDVLAEMMRSRDAEIKRITERLMSRIKYNLDIGIDDGQLDMDSRGANDMALEQLYNLERCMTILVQNTEDLNNRCQHQEKDVHYYQNLLKEKDTLLQESEKHKEELEAKLDLLWQNATKDA